MQGSDTSRRQTDSQHAGLLVARWLEHVVSMECNILRRRLPRRQSAHEHCLRMSNNKPYKCMLRGVPAAARALSGLPGGGEPCSIPPEHSLRQPSAMQHAEYTTIVPTLRHLYTAKKRGGREGKGGGEGRGRERRGKPAVRSNTESVLGHHFWGCAQVHQVTVLQSPPNSREH